MAKVTKNFDIEGMHCPSCEKLIENSVKGIKGIEKIETDYAVEKGKVVFDDSKTSIEEIFKVIEEGGYTCSLKKDKKPSFRFFGFAFGVIGLLVIGYFAFRFFEGINIPEISQNMGYGLLFLVGLLTGFHCVSMCGGFVVSYTAKNIKENVKSYKSHFMYGTGKVISYTIIGAGFGLLGSIIVFTPMMRGVAGIIAGAFLVVFGLNILNVFPWLRKIRINIPFVNKFVSKESKKHKNPLVIGLLNGLMIACGPLQAIYIMAAGTGSMIEGGKLLFVFALGTLPVMLGFGFFTSFVSNKATHKILKASGIIVIVLGLIMVNRGLALTGTGADANSLLAGMGNDEIDGGIVMENGYQVIRMDVIRYGWEPDKFVLKKGVPVKWIVNGKEINGCNNAIQVPKLGLKFDIKYGEQIIEFTPEKEGVISWSCWMGMIPGAFVVKDDVGNADTVLDSVELQQGSCGGSCGSPTCGAAKGGGCGCGR